MAKKQTRRSISVSRTTYERLKAFCEANNISMSQLVETRVNDFLGEGVAVTIAPRPTPSPMPSAMRPSLSPSPKPATDTVGHHSAFGSMSSHAALGHAPGYGASTSVSSP
ncbi:MAG TPA: hypothetical protein VK427_07510, partial [Kofleriaceae bacterium]|nr:hypothetical protein [Kofleriaceae bacterium]